MNRQAKISRKTKETDIELELSFDDFCSENQIDSGLPFLDHMLDAFSRHGKFVLKLTCKGDLEIDPHHSIEDIGIVLGQAIREALGDKKGIVRFGSEYVPMDESLARAAIDLSGRPYLGWRVELPEWQAGGISARLFKEFFIGMVNNAAITLHIDLLQCEEIHHGLEAIYKAFGRALRKAVDMDPRAEGQIPSTKGVLF